MQIYHMFHHHGRLKVREVHIVAIFGAKECAAQFSNGSDVSRENSIAEHSVHMLAPATVCATLFKDGNPFAQPARNFVAGLLQCDYVAELVPENGLPTGRMIATRGRTVGCDHFSEADSQKSHDVRHPKCADRKVVGSRIDLDNDRKFRSELVSRS